jgi:hypothetical protein
MSMSMRMRRDLIDSPRVKKHLLIVEIVIVLIAAEILVAAINIVVDVYAGVD